MIFYTNKMLIYKYKNKIRVWSTKYVPSTGSFALSLSTFIPTKIYWIKKLNREHTRWLEFWSTWTMFEQFEIKYIFEVFVKPYIWTYPLFTTINQQKIFKKKNWNLIHFLSFLKSLLCIKLIPTKMLIKKTTDN